MDKAVILGLVRNRSGEYEGVNRISQYSNSISIISSSLKKGCELLKFLKR